jgi:hypothetical protein
MEWLWVIVEGFFCEGLSRLSVAITTIASLSIVLQFIRQVRGCDTRKTDRRVADIQHQQ